MAESVEKKVSVSMYACTETFLSEQIESIINDIVLNEQSDHPMSHVNIENTVKAITEFLVICHRTNIGTSRSTMCRQLQLSLQGRAQTSETEDFTSHEVYYRLQYTVYEKLYEDSAIYALFCMPTLNSLAQLYLDKRDNPDKARKCLNNVSNYYKKYMADENKLPGKLVEDADENWIKKRTKECQDLVEYFYTASLKICARYYHVKENYRMGMKVGLRYLRRMTDIHTKIMKETQWIKAAIDLSLTCIHSRALPQSIYLLNAAFFLVDKMDAAVKREEHNNCGHVTRINVGKRQLIKQLRLSMDIVVIRVAIWILEESATFVFLSNEKCDEKRKDLEIVESVETFSIITQQEFPNTLPSKLCLEQKEFGALLKKTRSLMKQNKKVIMKSCDWTDFQTRVQKLAQIRI